jgi:hypothetical protein
MVIFTKDNLKVLKKVCETRGADIAGFLRTATLKEFAALGGSVFFPVEISSSPSPVPGTPAGTVLTPRLREYKERRLLFT